MQPVNKIQKNETPNQTNKKFVFNSANNKNQKPHQHEEQQQNIKNDEVIQIVFDNDLICNEIKKDRKPIRFLKLGKLKYKKNSHQNIGEKVTKDASTNTSSMASKSNASTQTQTIEFSFDYNKFENYLFNKVYLLLEDELLNEEFPNIFQQNNIINKSNIVYSNVVPNSPPTQAQMYKKYLNTTSLCDDTISDTVNSEATIILPSNSIPINKKTASLNESNIIKTSRSKPPLKKALPQLEFLDTSRMNNEDKSDTESNSNKEDEMIIVDTPVKEKTFSDSLTMEQMREIDRTLSRSANRMELVNSKIIVENSMVRYENSFDSTSNNNNNTTIIIENNENDQIISIIPDTVKVLQETSTIMSIEPVQIIPDTVKMVPVKDDVKKIPTQETLKMIPDTINSIPDTVLNVKVIPDTVKVEDNENEESTKLSFERHNSNHSLINSMLNSSVSNTMVMMPAPLLSLNSTSLDNNFSVMNKFPPQASDILGNSYLSSTTFNQSLSNKSSIENKSNGLNVTNDNVGQDSNKKKNSNKKYEFVGSLLKTDMKIMLKNFADTINAIVKNDVTDMTTHLIVDSSKLLFDLNYNFNL
jgi:hypothetical protein